MKKFDQMYIALALLLVALVGLIFWQQGERKTEMVASVNGDVITKQHLYDEMVKQSGQAVVDNLINERLIKQQIKKSGIKVTDDEVQKEIDKVKQQAGSAAQFKQMLDQYGMTETQLKDNLTMNLSIKKLLADKVKVTEQEMKDFYDQNKDQIGDFDKNKESIRMSLEQQKMKQEMGTWLNQLRKDANIVNTLEQAS